MVTRTIPEPTRVPFIGHLQHIDRDAPLQSMVRLARQHGPIYKLDILGRELTVISSQALVNEVCDEQRFDKKLSAPLENLRDLAGDALFTARTTEPNWAKAHRILMPAFGPLGLRKMF